MIKDKEFEWKLDSLEFMKEKDKDIAQKMLDMGFIHDVYKIDNKIVIEYTMSCIKPLISNLSEDKSIQKLIIPYNISNVSTIKCQNKDKVNCTANTCLILEAGYLFHKNRKLSYFNTLLENVDIWKEENHSEKISDYDDIKVEDTNIIFTQQDLQKHKDLIESIRTNELLSTEIKEEFLKLIKSLITYNSLKNDCKVKALNCNHTFIEDTDTVNTVCGGQSICINTLVEILSYFNFIKNDNIKYLNFKELTFDDSLGNEENYKEDVIVLTNLHYLTNKSLLKGSAESQENALIIKNNILSYIINNSHKKVFIICDREINVQKFYDKNPQMKYQFKTFKLPDLLIDQIVNIFLNKVRKKKWIKFDKDLESHLSAYLSENYIYAPYKNLEFIEFLYDDSIDRMLRSKNPTTLKISDFPLFKDKTIDELKDLNDLVGLQSVKKEIYDLKAFLKFKKDKEKSGDKMPSLDLHMVFKGNPGTGKTTVARLMAGILFNLEYIRYNKCIECESKDLIANVPGETAMKTSEKIQEAMGGILFIDEAYSISNSPYGAECIATLIKAMEDYRDDLIVILAGYKAEMGKFLSINSGFESRIAYTFDFVDYTNAELILMTENLLTSYNLKVDSYEVLEKLDQIYTNAKKKGAAFGNSRFVRNTVDKILRQHAINVEREKDEKKRNMLVTVDDVKI